MMIVITKQDLAKMSVELRDELMRLMFEPEKDIAEQYPNDFEGIDFEEHEQVLNEMSQSLHKQNESIAVKGKKVVIEINDEQASALVSNLSDKSISILKHFTSNTPVLVSSLVGKNKPYADFIELKRSFVGPVNRRLRTVTKNRVAVLFLKTDDGDSSMSVKPGTANSLKEIL